MAEVRKSFQTFGYPDEQFETVVNENLLCGICSGVFKDPVMCKNEHCFCRGCITEHLENYHNCPCCNQDLTVETLADAPRILRNLLSEQRIRCDHHKRGCQEIVQLGNLASHVAVCGKAPVLCQNEECSSEINREDQFRHQSEECRFRKEKCRNCKEVSSVVQEIRTSLSGLRGKVETVNTSVEDLKIGLTEIENKIIKKQNQEIESTPTNNASQAGPSSEFNDVKHPKQHGYIVAGGNAAEVFYKVSNSWIELKPMQVSRSSASSVLYNGGVLVTGGSSGGRAMSSMEQWSFNISPFIVPCWSPVEAKLPRPLKGHRTVLYKGHLIVLGGGDGNDDSDLIYEIQLQSPFNTKILAKLPPGRVMGGCGAVLVNDKIFIFGGGKEDKAATANVTMYDITKNEFKELEPLPYGVCDMATVKYGENVILAGGTGKYGSSSHSKSTVVSYNIETQKSTKLPQMKTARSECCAIVDGNALVVMGGRDEKNDQRSVEVFDFKTSKWSDFPSMNRIRRAFIAEIV